MSFDVLDFTLPNGEKTKLYPIRYVAIAVGRESKTVRSWEIAGVIPKTPFKGTGGIRLYTQEMIDVISSCAERCKISTGRCISNTNFTRFVSEGFDELFKKYYNKENKDE